MLWWAPGRWEGDVFMWLTTFSPSYSPSLNMLLHIDSHFLVRTDHEAVMGESVRLVCQKWWEINFRNRSLLNLFSCHIMYVNRKRVWFDKTIASIHEYETSFSSHFNLKPSWYSDWMMLLANCSDEYVITSFIYWYTVSSMENFNIWLLVISPSKGIAVWKPKETPIVLYLLT